MTDVSLQRVYAGWLARRGKQWGIRVTAKGGEPYDDGAVKQSQHPSRGDTHLLRGIIGGKHSDGIAARRAQRCGTVVIHAAQTSALLNRQWRVESGLPSTQLGPEPSLEKT